MKKPLIILLLFLSLYSFAQSKFSDGFNEGYKKGYCHDQGVGCLAPITPVAPTPNVNESMNSYQDGYNRGFDVGLKAQKSQYSNSTNSTRERYQTSKAEFISDNMYNPYKNIENTIALANALRESKGRALEYLQAGNYQAAADIAFAGLRILPNDSEFMLVLGQAYKDTGDLSNALKWYKKAVQSGFNNNDIKQLIIRLENGSYINSNMQQANVEKVNTSNIKQLFQSKDYEKVIEQLKSVEEKIDRGVITDKNDIMIVYSFIAYSYYYTNNPEQTIKYSTKVINNSPVKEIGEIYFIRSLSKAEMNDYYGSNSDLDYLIENYTQIRYSGNNLATLYNNKAYNLILLKKYDDAKPVVEKALSLDKKIDYIYDTKGELEYCLGNYFECIIAMTSALQLKETSHAYYFRGLAKIKLGNKTEGCGDLSKAGELGSKEAYVEINKYCK